jgi:hypothetical protein
MNATEATESGQVGRCDSARRLDRALTLGGYTPAGRYKDSTSRLYADAWADFFSWCRSSGRTPMPATPETIATYAAHLVEVGYAPETARSRITAVRARHRQLGHPVPDNVPAWSVLRAAQPTRPPRQVKGAKPADLLAAVETCAPGPAGRRNRAIALLTWDLTISSPELISLDIQHVHLPQREDDPVMVTIDGRAQTLAVEHDHEPTAVCAACAVREWIDVMRRVGITTGPLFRPVDRLGVIEGSGVRRAGAMSPTGDARLSKRSLYRIWAKMVTASGIETTTPRSLRIGGARHRVQLTGDVGTALERAGWSPTTGVAVSRLLPSTTSDDRQ